MDDLQRLFANEIDTIIVDNFLSPSQITTFLTVLKQHPEWKTAEIAEDQEHLFSDNAKPMHLFLTQYMVLSHGKTEAQYLNQCLSYREIWQKITDDCGFDPFELLTTYLKNNFNINIKMAGNSSRPYCPCVARDLSEEIITHADFGPFDGEGWAIDQVMSQLAWNMYFTSPGDGGDTIIYDHVWDSDLVADEHSYGIKEFDKPIKSRFSVKPGRLILFNCRNFHRILKATQSRIAIGGFLGALPNQEIIAWS